MARMEDVLDLYHQDYDPDHPVVCFDETSKQLVADKRPSIGAKPGRVERYDYEYKRNGTRNLFMFCEPKAGWRHVEVTERRTAVDFAHQEVAGRRGIPSYKIDTAGAGQPQHSQAGFVVRRLRASRSAADRQAPRVPLHTPTRQLAEHG